MDKEPRILGTTDKMLHAGMSRLTGVPVPSHHTVNYDVNRYCYAQYDEDGNEVATVTVDDLDRTAGEAYSEAMKSNYVC